VPGVGEVFTSIPDALTTLVDAWSIGPTTGDYHPLVELLLGEHHVQRREDLEAGFDALSIIAIGLPAESRPADRDSQT